MIEWNTPVQYIKGVGEKRAAQLHRLGIDTVRDLLSHYPRQYEDWTRLSSLNTAAYGETCCIKAVPLSVPQAHLIRKGLTLYRFSASDGTGVMQVTIFNSKFTAEKIKPHVPYLFYGTLTGTYRRPEMSSPMIEPAETGARIRPIYPMTEGINSRFLEKIIATVLAQADALLTSDPIPSTIRTRYGLCERRFAIHNIHFPSDAKSLSVARDRLVFEELFLLQLGLLRLKGRQRSVTGVTVSHDHSAEFFALLPFEPTGAQRRSVAECINDMRSPVPMNRLLQGDVGSGKTAVAAALAYTVIKNGYQCAMMAPTEILAEQHYRSLSRLFEPCGTMRIGLLTGSTPKAQKQEISEGLSSGSLSFVIGTHALLSENVAFSRLGLVITDEQHRFGVRQRAILTDKGNNPHLLVMSATPIPRTLALMIYGDLDISLLDELPAGRTPISTYAVGTDKRERVFNYIKKHIDEGRQAYIVCPLVEDGEESDLVSAQAYAETLKSGPFKDYTVGLLHGKMKPKDKDAVMDDFVHNRVSLLVSTTVIEVGVDVPNAVIMVIENADRFGLAQLHQLRGRVGRGQYASSCILISDAQNEEAVHRLKTMCKTTDGFRIADEDLKMRGPGDFFGSRQHGLPQLKIADLMTDIAPLKAAQEAARAVYAEDPALASLSFQGLATAISTLFEHIGERGLN